MQIHRVFPKELWSRPDPTDKVDNGWNDERIVRLSGV